MRFMNRFDLEYAARRFDADVTPNRAALVGLVTRLADWADDNSDGWAYWPKPARAAATAMGYLDARTSGESARLEREDLTDLATSLAVVPVKAFLTRQGVSDAERAWILGTFA